MKIHSQGMLNKSRQQDFGFSWKCNTVECGTNLPRFEYAEDEGSRLIKNVSKIIPQCHITAHTVPGERMNSPAMLQVANHCDGQPIYSADLFSDCENIQQRLSGMLTNAISCIDQRLAAIICCPLQHNRCCTVQGLFQTRQYDTTAVPLHTTYFNAKKFCFLPTQHTCASCDSNNKQRYIVRQAS